LAKSMEDIKAAAWKLIEKALEEKKEYITWDDLKTWFRKKKITKQYHPEVVAYLRYRIRKEQLPVQIVYSTEKANKDDLAKMDEYIDKKKDLFLARKKGHVHDTTIMNSVEDINEEHFRLIHELAPQFVPFDLDPIDIYDRLEEAIKEAQEAYSWTMPYTFDDWVWWFACEKMNKIIQRRKRKNSGRKKKGMSKSDIAHFRDIYDKEGGITKEDIVSYYGGNADIDYIAGELEDAGIGMGGGDESDLFSEIHTYSRAQRALGLVQTYLQEIGQVNLLTADQEKALAQKIEEYNIMEKKKEILEKRDRGEELSEEELAFLAEHGDDPVDEWEMEVLKEEAEYAWERLIISNLRLVVSIAKKYTGRGMDFMDLIQEGTIGLMKAVEKFEWRRGYKFSTYATWWIRQAITRALADQSRTIRIPVHMVETRNKYLKTKQELYHELGREPTTEEIAEAMGIDVEKVKDIETTIQDPKSLEATIGDEEDTHFGDFIEDPNTEKPEEYVARKEMKENLRKIIEELPEREREIIKLYYGLDDGIERSLDDVGQHFGITRERVRQILQKALKKLRSPHRSKKLRKLMRE